jgi:hypothetical protein
MSPERLEATINQNETLELANGISITQHTPTDGVDIRRNDWAFDGGPVIIPNTSLSPVAGALIEESPRDAAAWARVMFRHLSREEKANLAKDLIDDVCED